MGGEASFNWRMVFPMTLGNYNPDVILYLINILMIYLFNNFSAILPYNYGIKV
jgi:hypothetical protein